VNHLVGTEVLDTQTTRSDDVGRHTTTHRQLVQVPSGGMLIDTPGLREVVAWDADGSDSVFSDIDELMQSCRFNDCAHLSEPGCAVRAALSDGTLDIARLRQYQKMQRELRYTEERKDGLAARNNKRRYKEISKFAREHRKLHR
jgi:ribosome biogenesis GTPase / thiamine phosphate phosphatase